MPKKDLKQLDDAIRHVEPKATDEDRFEISDIIHERKSDGDGRDFSWDGLIEIIEEYFAEKRRR